MGLERISCPSCGASDFRHNPDGVLVCGYCGANFGSPQEHFDCPSCGVQNPPQARKCMNCGLTLGKTCPACNFANPPGADHCLQCATPLDTLSSVMMRTGQGKDKLASTLRRELVRTKGQDMIYMQEQRAKLDAEESLRQHELREQIAHARKQQRTLMLIATIGTGILVCGLVVVLVFLR